MNRYRCSSCGTEFEANSSAPTVTLSCGGLPVECHRIGAPPEVAERARIRKELLEGLDEWVGAAAHPVRGLRNALVRELIPLLDRICPPEEGA